jgi:hypothetical protein
LVGGGGRRAAYLASKTKEKGKELSEDDVRKVRWGREQGSAGVCGELEIEEQRSRIGYGCEFGEGRGGIKGALDYNEGKCAEKGSQGGYRHKGSDM